jgi:dTDP-4-dehydrorhamnose reductase
VFDGAKKSPYTEEDMPNPINHYAAGKLFGERAVLASSPVNLVLRTSWIFGSHPTQAKTFVHTVLKAAREGGELKSTTDQISVPTFVEDLAQWTLELVRGQFSGLVHAVNDEAMSRYDWARAILEEAVVAGLLPAVPTVVPVTTAYFNSTMRRPNYTVLNNDKLARLLKRRPCSWRVGLKKMLAHERRR